MFFLRTFQLGLKSLLLHPMRSLLTILGTVLLIPLLPVVFAVAAIWLIWRLTRRKPQVVQPTF